MSTSSFPALGSVWLDADGRELTVHGVFPGDRLGREVRGTVVLSPDGEGHDFSTTGRGFDAVFRERRPAAVFRE